MITHEDIKVVISLKVRCNKEVRKYLNDYIRQQETLEVTHGVLMLKYDLLTVKHTKLTELLEVYKGIDGGGSPEGLNKLYKLRDKLEKELEDLE